MQEYRFAITDTISYPDKYEDGKGNTLWEYHTDGVMGKTEEVADIEQYIKEKIEAYSHPTYDEEYKIWNTILEDYKNLVKKHDGHTITKEFKNEVAEMIVGDSKGAVMIEVYKLN